MQGVVPCSFIIFTIISVVCALKMLCEKNNVIRQLKIISHFLEVRLRDKFKVLFHQAFTLNFELPRGCIGSLKPCWPNKSCTPGFFRVVANNRYLVTVPHLKNLAMDTNYSITTSAPSLLGI